MKPHPLPKEQLIQHVQQTTFNSEFDGNIQ